MINILWADDQTDVVNTFKSVLAPLSPKISTVKNGEEAISRLRKGTYDLLLLDLKMPPGEWGGLWTLEELRKFNKKLPIIILSGEGTQNETIKALRLGAQDYVTKDRVQTELLQRITKILDEFEVKINDGISNGFPTPLALPFKRFAISSESPTRLHRLIEFIEAYLKFSCFVGACEVDKGFFSAERSLEIRKLLQVPSMGSWNLSRKVLGEILSNDSLFFKLNNCISDKLTSAIIGIRNDIAHGAEPSDTQAASYLKDTESEFQNFINTLWQYFDSNIVIPTKLQFDGREFKVNGVLAIGANTTFSETEFTVQLPMITNQAYLNYPEKNTWVNLFPFIVFEPSTEPLSWKIMIYDSLRIDRNKENLNGDELIKYLDLFSSRRNIIPIGKPTSKALPYFFTGL